MNFNKFKKNIKNCLHSINFKKANLNPDKIESFAVWTLPALIIPFGRKIIDKEKPPELKNELFLRDLTTYSIGGASFLVPRIITKNFLDKTTIKPLKNLSKTNKKFTSLAAGLIVNYTWCTVGTVKLAKKLNRPKRKLDIKEIDDFSPEIDSRLAFTQTYKNFRSTNKTNDVLMKNTVNLGMPKTLSNIKI